MKNKKCMVVNHFWPEKLHALPKVALKIINSSKEWVILSNPDKKHKGEVNYRGLSIKYCNPLTEDYSQYEEVVFCGSLFGALYYSKHINNRKKSAIISSKKYTLSELFKVRVNDLVISPARRNNFLLNLGLLLIPNPVISSLLNKYCTISVPSIYFYNSFLNLGIKRPKLVLIPQSMFKSNIIIQKKKSKSSLHLLFVSHSYSTRGLDILLKSFSELIYRHNLKNLYLLLLINPMPDHEKELIHITQLLKRYKECPNLQSHVGYITNLGEYYSKSHILIYPYRYLPDIFPYPLVIFEAKNYGCKVITSNFKNNMEITGNNDYLIDPLSVKDLKEAIFNEYKSFFGDINGI